MTKCQSHPLTIQTQIKDVCQKELGNKNNLLPEKELCLYQVQGSKNKPGL